MASSPRRKPGSDSAESLQFTTVNLALGAAGVAALVLGYWLLAGGSITLAPLLLVLGYVVLIPLAFLV